MPNREPLRVFISYAHENGKHKERLLTYLAQLKNDGLIHSWQDTRIPPGAEWKEHIDQNLEAANVILLLVSAEFLHSEYCYHIETKRALERHEGGEAVVIPVILMPSDWNHSGLALLQALPKGGKPISRWSPQSEGYLSVVNGIREVVEKMYADRAKAPVGDEADPALASQGPPVERTTSIQGPQANQTTDADWELVELKGTPYIASSGAERLCLAELRKPGMLIRIKSPDKMGKSMLMSRVLDQVRHQGYRSVVVDLRQANQEIFADINKFLQWFCGYAANELNIETSPTDTWKSYLGANPNATKYVDTVLLKPFDTPLVMAIDNFDCIFEHHPAIETDFCSLLRGWFEKVNTSPIWGQLRQLIVYSQESYGTMDINQSPLNVGTGVELDELNVQQVAALARARGFPWEEGQSKRLMDIVGGHPHLVQIALDQMQRRNLSLETLLGKAATEEGIYGDVLGDRLRMLKPIPSLWEAMRQVVNSDQPVRLGGEESFKLASMGLVRSSGNDCVPRCQLYRLYFQDRLR